MSYCNELPFESAGNVFETNNTAFQLDSPSGNPASFQTITLVNGTGAGIAQYSAATAGWSLCSPSLCGSVANSSWTLPVTFATYEALVVWTGASNASGNILYVTENSGAQWIYGSGTLGDLFGWSSGEVHVQLVGPGVGEPPPPPPIPIGQALRLGAPTSEQVTASGSPMAGCPRPSSGTEYCDVFTISTAQSQINSSGLRFWVFNQQTSGIAFNVTILNGSGYGIAEFGNRSGGTGWHVCTISICGPTVSSPGTLPINLTSGERLVVSLGSYNPSQGVSLGILGVGRFGGQLVFSLV